MLCESCKHPLLPPDALPTPTQTEVLLEHLRSSSVPQDPSGYEAAISASTAALMQYDSQIELLQETLERMRTDRTKLQEYTDACRSVFSPVRRLPPEILCEVFISVPSTTSAGWIESVAYVAKSHLLRISAVCASWRSLVIGTPRFWSYIDISPGHWIGATIEPDRRFLAALQMCLERGAQHPLTLSATFTGDSPLSPPVLDLLAQHSDRWQSVHFFIAPAELHTLRHAKGRVNMLQKLSLSLYEGDVGEDWIYDTDLFYDAPRLNHVLLPLPFMAPVPRLPWKQLLTFTCCTPHFTKDLISIMALMANLSHPEAAFELHNLDDHVEYPLHLPLIKSTIASLTFVLNQPKDEERSMQILGKIMGCLALTDLHELHIRSRLIGNMTPWPVIQFQSLSWRSSFHNTLRVLEIPGLGITDDQLVLSLVSLDCLERLIIADRPGYGRHNLAEHSLMTDSLLLRLTCTPDTSNLVPRLNYVHCTSLCKFSTDVFFDFMASRVLSSRGVFEAVVRCHEGTSVEFEPGMLHKVSYLVSAGALKFRLEHM
ncbi:hypothetical protein DFH06DRAFT_1463745 [Mycena polygramma]|nr:hypothetical protein DFH06DRAFT_1463745 [Mycena polygramma]